MAKRKWPWESTKTLLSWLDFSLKYMDIDHFEKTIVDRLGGEYTIGQIDGKLQRLWNQGGPNELSRKEWRDIKERGSISLHNHDFLTEEQINDIALAVEELEKDYLPGLSTPNRRLRSTSRLETVSSDQSSRLNTPTVEENGRAHRRKRKLADALTPSTVKDEIVPVGIVSSKKDIKARKRPKTYSKRDRFSSIRVIVPLIQVQRLSLEARESSSSARIEDSEEPVSDALDRQPNGHDSSREMSIPFGPLETEDSESCLSVHSKKDSIHDVRTILCICDATKANQDDGTELIACNQCKISQHTACVRYLCQECTKCAQQTVTEPPTRSSVPQIDSSTETDDLVDPRLQFAVANVQELEEVLADKERELQESLQKVADLEQDIHFLNEARKQRDEQNGPSVEEQMVRLQKQVHKLHEDLRARHRLGTFTKLTPESRYEGARIDIKSSFDEVYHSNNMMFRGMEIEEFPFIPQLQSHERLLGLAEIIVGSQVDSVAQLQEGYFLSINPVVLLRSLATAALQRWVFETDFPSFASDSSTTLAVYRDLLVRQDGALALRNLDLAAFEAKLGRPEFLTSLLPKQAKKLAVRLLQTLAPFFTRNPQHLDELSYVSFADWGDEVETWKERQEMLVKVFTEALTTKANSCLNIEDYEMVMYAPGTKFDAKTMEAEKMDGTADISDPDGRVIQICIQAAVFVYARSPVQNDASVSNSIIPSKNFVRKAEHERGIPRVKAFVVLADGN